MRTLRSADLATGLFLSGLAILTLLASMQIAGTAGERVHPRTLPVLLGWMILAGGIGLTVTGWRYRGEPKLIAWPDRDGTRRVLITLAGLVVYMATLESLGFPLSSLVFISFMVWYLGRYRLWAAILCGLASAAAILFLFIMFLGLTFPLGLLELL
ncbi:MAG: tripartite tricarboxylate transporter TctB family protein [Chloroflexota bacterium]